MNGRTDDTRKPAVDNCLVESEVAPEPLWVRCLIGPAGSIGSLAQLNFGDYVVTRSCTLHNEVLATPSPTIPFDVLQFPIDRGGLGQNLVLVSTRP